VSHSYQTWFTWLSGNCCFCLWVAWPRDHEVRIIWYQSLVPLIRLYPSEIFVSCWFRKNSSVSNFFFSLNLQHINKIVISFCYCSKYISSIKNKKKNREKQKKKLFKKTFIRFCCRKLNKRKLDQINSELAQIYTLITGVLIAPHIKFGVNWISFAWGLKFGSNQVWFIMFLRQYIKPCRKLLKLYIFSIWVDIALYLKF
jgi:hypothetical protein